MSSTYRTCVRCTIGRAPIWHLLLALAFSVGDHSGRPHHSSSIQRAQIPLGAMFLRGAGPAGDGRYPTGRHCARFLPRSSNRTPVAIYRDLACPLAITTDPLAGISGTALAGALDSPATGGRTVDGMCVASHIHTLYSQERQRDLLARAHRQRLARQLGRLARARERTGRRRWHRRTALPATRLLPWQRAVR